MVVQMSIIQGLLLFLLNVLNMIDPVSFIQMNQKKKKRVN